MASKALPLQGTEAYFLSFMAGELPEEEMVGVMMSRKFWDFLASTLPEDVREGLADEMVKRTLDYRAAGPERRRVSEKAREVAMAFSGGEQGLQERDDTFQALYAGVPEGGRFWFLRDFFCGLGEAREESGKSGAPDVTVWESMKSDEQAEHRLFGRHMRIRFGGAWKGDERSSRSSIETGKVLEWTESDSEAEREEAQRQLG